MNSSDHQSPYKSPLKLESSLKLESPSKSGKSPDTGKSKSGIRDLETEKYKSGKKDSETPKTVKISEKPIVDVCIHIPARTWKNYNPTRSDFICAKCCKPISFTPETKTNVNVLTLVLSILILLPIIISDKVDPWKIGILALLVLTAAISIQLYFVKRGRFIPKDPYERKR